MELTIPGNKLFLEEQSLTIDNKILTFVGENGCGKSAILESIFRNHLNDNQNQRRLITFSSGNNESFSSIFRDSIRQKQRFIINNFDDEQKFENAINVFYFDKDWVKFLIFFATSLKRDGKVINLLKGKDLVDVNEDEVDITTKLEFPFRITKDYNDRIINALAREAEDLEYSTRSIRNTFFHQFLTQLTEHIHSPDFDLGVENSRIIKSGKRILAKDVAIVLGTDSNKIFSFLAWASLNNKFIFRNEAKLFFKNNIELNDLSDGEHQLLAIYSLIDLFDSDETLYLLDEVDSHLYYKNIEKLWLVFEEIEGKVITTTHSADSIILNHFSNIKLIKTGKIESNTIANKIFDRLNSLASSSEYKFQIAKKIEHIALVEDPSDWFIFLKLCERLDLNIEALSKIHFIKCPSGYEHDGHIFGSNKVNWVEKFKQIDHSNSLTKSIFMICDKDALNIDNISPTGLLKNMQHANWKNKIPLDNGLHNSFAHLMSWKRREIENYLLSYTMLSAKGKLDEVQNYLPQNDRLIETNPNDNNSIRNLDIKDIIKSLYSTDSGISSNKLEEIISLIPANEISEDIRNMHRYITNNL